MGAVYEAVRESLKSRVALKVMHPHFRASAEYLRRFHNEARAAAQLHHTNIVSVFDYGEHDGICYYAMQYIAGHSLHEILAEVRRLRLNQRREQPAPLKAGSNAPLTLQPAHDGVVNDVVETEAAPLPLIRSVTLGLLSGQFAGGAGVPADLEAGPAAASTATQLGASAQPRMTRNLGFELGRTLSPDPSPQRDDDRNRPDSSASLSSSALTGRGEDRYHHEVARLGAQVADALAYAHKRGVFHRDIKPSNLLLDAIGNVWVTDFGLAKFEEGEDLSKSEDVVGTLRYMAPERMRGVSDRRCDIYALGATLCELLTLRPVFESADRLRLINQIVHEPPAPLRQVDPRIPRDLETIVLKTLAKDPKDRFAAADDLAAELRRFLENRPIRSRPISAPERLWRWCKRNPAVAALSMVAAALTVLVAIGSTLAASALWFEQRRTTASLRRVEMAEHTAQLARGQSLVSEGAALQRSGLAGQRFDSLDRLAEAAQILAADPEGRKRLPQIRNHAIAALSLFDLRVRSSRRYGDNVNIAMDHLLERYALTDGSATVVIRRLDDDRELARLQPADQRNLSFAGPVFSPDGELLAARPAGSNSLWIWDLQSREVLATLQTSSANYAEGRSVIQPDGRGAFSSARATGGSASGTEIYAGLSSG
jgi:eukaryotic-like serine/threonine-protein kinase